MRFYLKLLFNSRRITPQICNTAVHWRIGGSCDDDAQQVLDVAVGCYGRTRMDAGLDNR